MKSVYIIGTCDTKYNELDYVRNLLDEAGIKTKLVDVGMFPHAGHVDISNAEVAACHPNNPDFLQHLDDRGKAVIAMSEALEIFLRAHIDDIAAAIGMGGSGNTSLVTRGLRALPFGMPKVMVSTVASGDVSPYVGPNDIFMLYSVADIAGMNMVTRAVLGNAAHAVAGMVEHTIPAAESKASLPLLGMSMFGVTTPCVEQLRALYDGVFEPLVFHATGTGGQSLEKLIDSGVITRVMDVTLTEVCDLFMNGVFSAGPDRMGAIIRTKIPYTASVGALDMVNFGAMPTVPQEYKHRKLHVHNANVTLMRTTPEENAAMGRWIGEKLNQCEGKVRFLLPEGGVSMLDAPGMPFYDPEADEALFTAIETTVKQTADRQVIRVPFNINDAGFVAAFKEHFDAING